MSPSPSPSDAGFVLRTAANTGLAGAGISEGSLTNQGNITYSTAGQTITGRRFTGQVTVTAANVTISGCLFERGGSAGAVMLLNESGSGGLTVEDCTFRCTSTTSGVGWCIRANTNNLTVRRCDVSGGENCLTSTGNNLLVEDSFLHYPSSADPAGHNDTIEIYGGSDGIIRRSTVLLDHFTTFTQSPTEPINVAPWAGSFNVVNLLIEDNFIDGDYFGPILLDSNQSGSHTVSVSIIKNRFGGHSRGGQYGGILNIGGVMTRVSTGPPGTDQFYCPYTGSDANYWWYCAGSEANAFGFDDLSPDRTGQLYAG